MAIITTNLPEDDPIVVAVREMLQWAEQKEIEAQRAEAEIRRLTEKLSDAERKLDESNQILYRIQRICSAALDEDFSRYVDNWQEFDFAVLEEPDDVKAIQDAIADGNMDLVDSEIDEDAQEEAEIRKKSQKP